MTSPYNLTSSLEWKLGIHCSEWRAALELAYRTNNQAAMADLDNAHKAGVIRLLREHLELLEQSDETN